MSSTSLSRHASVAGPGTLGNTGRFRNVFGAVVPERCFEGLAVAVTSPTLLRCNDRFFATPWSNAAGGLSGSLAVHSVDAPGKVNRTPYLIRTTGEQLLDFDFYPFDRCLIATAGRDSVVKIWRFPGDGQLVFDLTAAESYLAGHEKRVDQLKFHPTVADLLLTASSDMTMRLWDFRTMQELQILEGFEEPTLSIAWSYAGDLVLQSCKDGKLNMYDPRAKNSPSTVTDFAAAKGLGLCFINDAFDFVTTAFDKAGDRQVCVWDGRKMDKPLQRERAGNSPGAFTPFYDPSIGLLYLSSKGEGIRLYEYTEADRSIKFLNEIKTERPQTAVAMMPKFICDVDKFEVGRFLKLCNDSFVQTVSVRIPRKAGKYFPEDLFPPTAQPKPSADVEKWRAGAAAAPVLMDMKPEGAVSIFDAPPEEGGLKRAVTRIKKKKEAEAPEGYLQLENRGFFYSTWEYRWVAMLGSRIHIAVDRDDAQSLTSIALVDIAQLQYHSAREDEEQTIFAIILRTQTVHRFKTASSNERDRWLKALGDATGHKPAMQTTGGVAAQPTPDAVKTPPRLTVGRPQSVASDMSSPGMATPLSAKKTTLRGEVYRDGFLDLFSEGWFGTAKWARRYVVLQDGVINAFANERAFLDSSSMPLESFRLETIVSIRLCDPTDSADDPTVQQGASPEMNVFQLATPRESIFYKAADVQAAMEWIHMLLRVAGKAVRAADRKRRRSRALGEAVDADEDSDVIPEEMFSPVIEGYIVEGGAKLWLAIINGDFYYYKSNMGRAPHKVYKAKEITGVSIISQPGVNGFELIVRGQIVRHFTRTDHLAQWWTRKILYIRDANFDLMEFIGLKTVTTDANAREELERRMAPLLVDPLRVKNGEQPVLLQVHPKRNLAQQVPLTRASLASDASFVLDAGATIYQWNGPLSSRVCAARGADLANRIRIKDRGGNATIVFVNDTAGRAILPFYKLLGIENSVQELAAEALPTSTSAPFRGVKVYQVNPTKDSKKVLQVVYDEAGDRLPSKDTLKSDFNYVIDADGELFVWSGSASSLNERKVAFLLAGVLATQASRQPAATITKVLENTETMVFKEKFCDYPGMLPVNVGPMIELNENYVKMEQPEINIAALQNPVFPEERDVDDAQGTIDAMWIIRKRRKAMGDNYEFDKELLSADEYGIFYAGESYLLRYKYLLKSAEKYVVYFWQGRDSSVTEKGASALETINVADETGGDATHVRVEQGKEPRHFFKLFAPRGIVVRLGKQAAGPPAPDAVRQFQVRELANGQVRAVEAENARFAFHSEHVAVVCRGADVFCWNGRYSSLRAQQAVTQHNILRLSSVEDVVAVDEDKEPPELVALYSKDEWAARDPGRKQQKLPTRVFAVSGSSGVVVIEPLEVFTQDDLEDSHVYILDCITDVYVWIGSKSMQNEKTIAMETAQKYIVDSPRGHKPYTNIWVTYPYEEPLGFARHFHVWSTSKVPADKRERVPVLRPVDKVLGELNVKTYAFSVLSGQKLPEGVDRTRLEEYLSDEEFARVFAMGRDTFLQMPKWKQEQLKRQKKLF